MEFKSKITTHKEDVKDAKAAKAEEALDRLYKQMLYGAGKNGWTVDWYNKLLNAHKNGTLYTEVVEVNRLLAEDKPEMELTDDERLLLLAYAHPKEIIKIKAASKEDAMNSLTVVKSIQWHRLNNFRKIWEVAAYCPDLYNQWVQLGWIPVDKQITKEEAVAKRKELAKIEEEIHKRINQ